MSSRLCVCGSSSPAGPLPTGFKVSKSGPGKTGSTAENLMAMFQPPPPASGGIRNFFLLSDGCSFLIKRKTVETQSTQPTQHPVPAPRQPPKMPPPQPPLHPQISDIAQPPASASQSAPPNEKAQPKRGGHSRSQSCGAIEGDGMVIVSFPLNMLSHFFFLDAVDQSDSTDDSNSPGITPSNAVVIKGKSVEVLEQLGKGILTEDLIRIEPLFDLRIRGATATVWKASIDDHIVALKTVSLVVSSHSNNIV